MPNLPDFFRIDPPDWLFQTHGDVRQALKRTDEYQKRVGSLDGAELHIEEFVRQWALRCLMDQYKYPAEWMGGRIITEEPVKMGSTTKQSDISIKNTTGRTYLYIEVKNKGVSEEDFSEAERQLEGSVRRN